MMESEVKKRQLSAAELKRLEKFKHTRGRKKPAKIPARLARTSAFAPKKTQLITDSKFERLYIVPGHSVIKVSGRELGTQHRDAIYALFRLPNKVVRVKREEARKGEIPWICVYRTTTTWRALLRAMGRTEHTNNLMTLTEVFEDIKKVAFTVIEGVDPDAIAKAYRSKDHASLSHMAGRGGLKSLIGDVQWTGLKLDSEVTIEYGDWAANMITTAKLVSLNADVQFRLKSDYAKTFWPYIDSMNNHTFVDEPVLAALAGRNLWDDEKEDRLTRGQFRRETKKAFADMKGSGGLKDFRVEETGAGRRKSRRYHYELASASPAQMELSLA